MQYCPECGTELHERWASACRACGAGLEPYHAARTGEQPPDTAGADGRPRGRNASGRPGDPAVARTSPGDPDGTRTRPDESTVARSPSGDPDATRTTPGSHGSVGTRRTTGSEPDTQETVAGDGPPLERLRRVLPFERGAAVGGVTVLCAYLLTYLGFVTDRLLRGASGLGAFGPTNAATLGIGGVDVEVAVWKLVGWLCYGGMNVPLVTTDGANVALFDLPAVSGAVTPLLYAGVVALATLGAGLAVAGGLPQDRRPTTVEAAGSGATIALGFVPVALVGTLVVEASNVGPALGATAAYAAGFAAVGGAGGGLLARTFGLAGG